MKQIVCKHCKTPLQLGEFICVSHGSGVLDRKDTSAGDGLKTGYSLLGWFSITSHSDHYDSYKNVDIVKYMDNDYIDDWSRQRENYFCSKQCVKDWFGALVDGVSDPHKE